MNIQRKHSGSAFMLFLMIYYLFIAILLPVVVHSLRQFGLPVGIVFSPWFLIFTQLIGLLLPLGVWLAFKKENLSIHLPHMKLGTSNLIYIFAISLFLQPAMMVISGLSSLLFPNDIAEMLGGMMDYPLVVMLLAAAVTPAICEELVFRGYIQSQYKHQPFKKAALINGLFFAMIHLNPQQFVYAFVMGVIFAYMVHYTRSILAAVLSHFLMNGSQVTLLFIGTRMQEMTAAMYPYAAPDTTEYTIIPFGDTELIISPEHAMIFAILFMGFVALLATPCAVILFRSFISHNRARNIKYDMAQALIIEDVEPIEVELQMNSPRIFGILFDPYAVAVVVIFLIFILLIAL